MAPDKKDKRILVVSDDKRLSRAIELNLHNRLAVDIVMDATGPLERVVGRTKNGDLDLIVVAASSLSSEPVITLARARLAHHIGRIPILLISDRPVAPAPDTKIDHLAYPFGINELCEAVKEILQIQSP
jgi:DNA-binding response OmpR family regulator